MSVFRKGNFSLFIFKANIKFALQTWRKFTSKKKQQKTLPPV